VRTTRAVPRANLSGVELRRFVREREVLAELATGFSNRVVAQRLVLSQRAVKSTSIRFSPSSAWPSTTRWIGGSRPCWCSSTRAPWP